MCSINCRGKILSLSRPLVMGVVNVTEDSFYEGSRMPETALIMHQVSQMVEEGVDIIDIGGQSTRPGSARLKAEDEWKRIKEPINSILQAYPGIIISVDTYQSRVAENAIQAGVHIINDISAGEMDPQIIKTVAAYRVPFICMHMQGTPETMQINPSYHNITAEVIQYLARRIDVCRQAGIHDIIIDPGFCFGKTINHNLELLYNLDALHILKHPILAGLSRKSTIYKTLGVSANEALNGTTVLNTIALMRGVHILRVHDVREAREAITLTEAIKKAARISETAND